MGGHEEGSKEGRLEDLFNPRKRGERGGEPGNVRYTKWHHKEKGQEPQSGNKKWQ